MEKNKDKKIEEKAETKEDIIKDIEKTGVPKEIAQKEEKLDEKASEPTKGEGAEKPSEKIVKKPAQEKPKRTEAIVNGKNIPASTKHCKAICRFIKGKKISDAMEDLKQVSKLRKAVPMKGEIPHRRGEIMSGRFPEKAAKEFIVLLKSLGANANQHGIEDPIISLATANIGERPFGRYGVRRKRTHIKLVARASGREKNG